ncbi:pyridoxal-phosphate dependent enzyme [Mesorhizobium sp. IMUNJ 23232]|uniref:pyridoxal-phosphate dependent enzyme n=1 Tax=Mesorhizobium sp. IMUNJ 23232 TaxID=3376064 RepID=UPI0037A91448
MFDYAEFPTSERTDEWQVYTEAPTLGEGDTPLIDLAALASEIGVSRLALKNEGANPTGSHKDRMSRLVVARALDVGASTVSAASSGNAGVSLAAYAAHAGLKCVILSTRDIAQIWRHAIEMHGASLILTDTAEQRWTILGQRVRAGEWYPATNFRVPAVGSNPFGVDGYRAIAFELFRLDRGMLTTDIIVPTSRGDLLWGIVRGFKDLRAGGYISKLPRVHAVEPFQRISKVLAGADYRETFPGNSALTSIGGTTVTFQAISALRECKGTVVVAGENEARDDQKRLARQGILLELSSAATLTGLRQLLRSGAVPADASVTLIGTARGFGGEVNRPEFAGGPLV